MYRALLLSSKKKVLSVKKSVPVFFFLLAMQQKCLYSVYTAQQEHKTIIASDGLAWESR